MTEYSFVLLFIILGCASADSTYYECYNHVSRRAIANYAPLIELKMASLETCMQHCIMTAIYSHKRAICKSFTYNKHFHSCKLFDHKGYKVPAVIHPRLGVDLFTRNSAKGNCRGPIIGDDTLGGNPNFHLLNPQKTTRTSVKDQYEPEPKLKKQFSHDITHFRTHDAPSTGDTFANKFGENADSDLVQIDSDVSIEKESGSSFTAECETGYYVVLGTEIEKSEDTEGMVQVLHDTDQGDCARLCSSNQGLQNIHFTCKSLNYYPAERKCELYSIQVEPNGPGKFLANPSTIYSEKFCIPPSDRICQKDEVFILHVQKAIQGRLIRMQESHGITPCLQLCMNTASCKSAVYKDEEDMCYLYKEDLSRNVHALIDTEPGAVAIENSCSERIKSKAFGYKTYSLKKVRIDESMGSVEIKKC